MTQTATSASGDSLPSYRGHGRRVHVSDEVMSVWRAHRQVGAGVLESFGVLVGTTSDDRREVWIESVTTPMAQDQRSRASYKLRDPGHQRRVRGEFFSTHGQAIYLGTWHTHPEPLPTPSRIDRNDWCRCLRRNPGRPLAFVIVGTDTISVFVRAGCRFRPLTAAYEAHG